MDGIRVNRIECDEKATMCAVKSDTITHTAYNTMTNLRTAITDLNGLIELITGEEPHEEDFPVPNSLVSNIQSNEYLTSLICVKLSRLKEIL